MGYFKLSLILLFVIGPIFMTNGEFFNHGCGDIGLTLNTNTNIQKCNNEFKTSIKPFINPRTNEAPSASAVCCQINIFVACITKEVNSVCQSGAKATAKSIIRQTLRRIDCLSDGKFDCHQWYYQPESALCWHPALQWLAGILAVLLLTSCCCCCCGYCCRAKKTNGGVTSRFTTSRNELNKTAV